MQTASEDFSDIPTALDASDTYWGIGGVDPIAYQAAALTMYRSTKTYRSTTAPRSPPIIESSLYTGNRFPGSSRRSDGMVSA